MYVPPTCTRLICKKILLANSQDYFVAKVFGYTISMCKKSVLFSPATEQYDTFVKFTHDQVERRLAESAFSCESHTHTHTHFLSFFLLLSILRTMQAKVTAAVVDW